MRKVLIFYSKTGSGHLMAAQAIKEEIQSQNRDIEVVLHEGLGKNNVGLKSNPSQIYAVLSKELQWLYNFFYLLTNNRLGVVVLRTFIKLLWGDNLKKIIESEKPDLIITTHHHISPSTIFKPDHMPPFVTVVTDLGYPHLIWYDKNLDKIITPTEVIKSAASIFSKKVEHIDYPLKKGYSPDTSTKFKNAVLVLGGGLGTGNIEKAVDILLKGISQKIIVVCGGNEKLFNGLKKLASRHSERSEESRLEVFGFVNNLDEIYKKADIVITKAGPGTIAEAATLRKPLILSSWVGMQEQTNIKYVQENQLGIYEPDTNKLPEAVNRVYASYDKYTQGDGFLGNGAKKIAEYVLKEYS